MKIEHFDTPYSIGEVVYYLDTTKPRHAVVREVTIMSVEFFGFHQKGEVEADDQPLCDFVFHFKEGGWAHEHEINTDIAGLVFNIERKYTATENTLKSITGNTFSAPCTK